MKLLLFLLLPLFSFAQTGGEFYTKAVDAMEHHNYSEANKQIDQAISLDNDNLEYRWIKAKVNLTSNSHEENFNIAINNLNYIIKKGGKSSKIYNALGVAERELGREIRNFREVKKDYSYTDNNNQEIQQSKIYMEALSHFNLAVDYFKQAEELKPGSSNNAMDDIINDINDLKSKLHNKESDYQVFKDFFDDIGLNDEQKKIMTFYKSKKFENKELFFKDLKKIGESKLFNPSEFQSKCLEYYFTLVEKTGDLKSLKKYDNFEIFAFAEGQCYIRDN